MSDQENDVQRPPIEIFKQKNTFTVRQGQRHSDQLYWEEMLGLVAAMTVPKSPLCMQWLKTQKQHDRRKSTLKKGKTPSKHPISFPTKSENPD
jgi:hypothetical protein